jgi:hypothetical protein
VNLYAVIEALLKKTVARGCTPQEAESAQNKARELAARHGINIKFIQARIEQETRSRRTTINDAMEEMLRKMQEEQRRRDAAEYARVREEKMRRMEEDARKQREAAEAEYERKIKEEAEAAARQKTAAARAARKPKTPAAFDAEEAVRLYKGGMRVVDIAVHFGYKRGTGQNRIAAALVKAGVYKGSRKQ